MSWIQKYWKWVVAFAVLVTTGFIVLAIALQDWRYLLGPFLLFWLKPTSMPAPTGIELDSPSIHTAQKKAQSNDVSAKKKFNSVTDLSKQVPGPGDMSGTIDKETEQ